MKNMFELLRNAETLAYAFWLSVSLLVLVSLLKYFISKESDKKDWGHLILELPIDICLVVITIVITGFMKGENISLGIILVVVTLVISIICCIFRRCSISCSYKSDSKICQWVYGFLDIVFSVFWVYIVYSNIC